MVRLVKRIEVLDPFIPGVNHYLVEIWLGSDGKYYVTSKHGKPYPNDPKPTEEIAWDKRRTISPPFDSVEEAKNWFFED